MTVINKNDNFPIINNELFAYLSTIHASMVVTLSYKLNAKMGVNILSLKRIIVSLTNWSRGLCKIVEAK